MYLLLFLSMVSGVGPNITKKELDNGLRVIFVEDHSLPVFGGIVQFDNGSVYEHPGITGISHLLEHMLFKGTEKLGTVNYEKESEIIEKIHNLHSEMEVASTERKKEIKEEIEKLKEEEKNYVVPEEIWAIYAREGGTWMNAFTGETTTQYFVMLPSNKKEVWAKIESDRFRNPVLREFYSERDVVNEERRMYEARPGSVLWTHFMNNSYVAAPVRWSIIGWTSDIMNVTPEDVMNYYREYYIPQRCVIVMVGDVYPDKDFELIEKYFGRWEKKERPMYRLTEEPEQNGMRRAHVNFPASRQMMVGFHGPYLGEDEYYAATILTSALSTGRSSIFEKTLVKKGVVSSIGASVDGWEGKARSLISITGYPMDDVEYERMEKEIFSLVDSLEEYGISEKDLRRAKNNYKMDILSRRRYILWLGIGIGNGERVMGDPEYYKKELKMIDAVDNEDIVNLINKYIRKEKTTVVTLGEDKS